jgi:hypothetical protein
MSDAFTLNFIEALNVNLALGYFDFRLALWLIHWLKLVGSTSLKLDRARQGRQKLSHRKRGEVLKLGANESIVSQSLVREKKKQFLLDQTNREYH